MLNDLHYRRLDSTDVCKLLPGYCRYLREFDHQAREEDYRDFLNEMLEQSWVIGMGGFAGDELMAFVLGDLSFSPLRRSRSVNIFDLYVDKRMRGLGTVNILLKNYYAYCKEQGVDRIFGNAEPSTLNFFLRSGWRRSHQYLIVRDLI